MNDHHPGQRITTRTPDGQRRHFLVTAGGDIIDATDHADRRMTGPRRLVTHTGKLEWLFVGSWVGTVTGDEFTPWRKNPDGTWTTPGRDDGLDAAQVAAGAWVIYDAGIDSWLDEQHRATP